MKKLDALSTSALAHLQPQHLTYSLLLAALGLGYGCGARLNQKWSDEALNHGTEALFDWEREIVLVTGGAGGIGGEIVQHMAAAHDGATQVVVLDVLPLTFAPGPNVHYYECDITNHQALKDVAARIRQDVGDPTVVVANAGICRGKALLDATEQDIEQTIGVNTLGLLWTIKTFLPPLVRRNHGHLLLLASVTGSLGTARSLDYCASKAAALAVYEGLHTEIKHVYDAPAVRVSCVSPSLVRTDMFRGFKPVPGVVGGGMSPRFVAARIVDVLHAGRARNIVLSRMWFPPAVMRLMPEWMRVRVQDQAAASLSELRPHNPMAAKL